MFRLILLLLGVILTNTIFAQFLGLESEVHATSEFGTTYHIYAEFASPTDECIAVYSIGSAEINPVTLETSVTTAFYQNGGGANLGSGINAFFLTLLPDLAYDSWFTIGSETSDDPTVSAIGMSGAFTEFNAGNGFILDGAVGGSWYVTPESNALALAGDDGQVLLGQFTVEDDVDGNPGHMTCDWNIQWRDGAGVSSDELGATHNTADNSLGCTSVLACNYNTSATEDDASCVFPEECDSCSGESDGTGSVVDNDSDNDGVCDADEVEGCPDPTACNYDASATDDSGGCIYAMTYDCSGACINDFDGDGVCNELEVSGCTFSIACNYDSEATEDDGSCIFYCPGCVNQLACNFDPNAIQDDGSCIYPSDIFGVDYVNCNGNCLNDNDGDGVCDEEETQGCMDSNACDYNEAATDQLLPCEYPDEGYNCEGGCLFDFDEDGICDEFDSCPEDPENDADGDGVCANNEIEGCTNEQACNFVPPATEEDGSCLLVETICGAVYYTCDCSCNSDIDGDEICDEDEVPGCQEMSACNYNPDATDSDGSCEWSTCAGCIYIFACNYDPNALYSDGSCEFGTCPGCTNPLACNFNPTVSADDGSCYFAEEAYDCQGICLNDANNDGLCDEFEYGCTDQFACNYTLNADNDDGTCEYISCVGCTDASACNYNAAATADDGSCEYIDACGVCGGDGIAEGACDCDGNEPSVGYDCDGVCLVDTDEDGICDANEIEGCTDESACNFEVSATDDDGSCAVLDECGVCGGEGIAEGFCDCEGGLPAEGYDCTGACLNDADGDGICDEFEVVGCTDELACNYDAAVTDDDGSCLHAEVYYDCEDNCLNDDDSDGVCNELETQGCMDEAACNYNTYATDDDESCDYCQCLNGTVWNDDLQGCEIMESALIAACGEGTYWDDLAQACLTIETCQEDLDGDGIIGVEDLLQLLSSFGMECDPGPETSE